MTTETQNKETPENIEEAPESVSPMEGLKTLEPLEVEKFLRFEAQMKACLQEVRIVDFELLEFKRQLQAKTDERNRRRRMLQDEFNIKLKPKYQVFLEDLAEKYEISEPSAMLIDTEAGTIRDSSEV